MYKEATSWLVAIVFGASLAYIAVLTYDALVSASTSHDILAEKLADSQLPEFDQSTKYDLFRRLLDENKIRLTTHRPFSWHLIIALTVATIALILALDNVFANAPVREQFDALRADHAHALRLARLQSDRAKVRQLQRAYLKGYCALLISSLAYACARRIWKR